ncbi:MAG: Ig-like domain-containing protein, partial [Pantoea dispersa]
IGSVKADDNGLWQWQYPADKQFSDGLHSLVVKAQDLAGNISIPSAPFIITVDSVIAQPVIVSITDNVAGGTSGALPADGTGLTNDNRPVMAGRAEAGSLVTIYDGSSAIASVIADSAGSWSWQYPVGKQFSEGVHILTAKAVDAAGNISSLSAPRVITVDTVIAQPTISSVVDAQPGGVSGVLPADGVGLTNDNRPVLKGGAEAGSLVTIYNGSTAIGSVKADDNGLWQWQYPAGEKFSEGKHILTVKAEDTAGNISSTSTSFTITVDITPPVVSTLTIGSIDPLMKWVDNTTNDTQPQLKGYGEVGSLVQIYQNGLIVASFTVIGNGDWTWQPADALKDDTYSFQVNYQDNAGNISPLTTPLVITIDTTPPVAVSNIEWDGETLTISFGSDDYQVGDRMVMKIDGIEKEYILNQDDINSGKFSLSWPSSKYGNFDDLEVHVIDIMGNSSESKHLDRSSIVLHQENFESYATQTFTTNQVVHFSGFDLNVVNAAGGGLFKGIPGWQLPSPTMALTFFGGTKIEMILPDHDSDFISFIAGDFNNTEKFTVVFYDRNGNEVDRQILTPSGGITQEIKASVPFGMTFSKVSLELNTSGVWIDNIVMGKNKYDVSTTENSETDPANQTSSTLSEIENIGLALLSGDCAQNNNDATQEDINYYLDSFSKEIFAAAPEELHIDVKSEYWATESHEQDALTLERLLGDDVNLDDWNNSSQCAVSGEANSTWQEITPQSEFLIQPD